MNREIKFRIFDIDKNKMIIEGFGIFDQLNCNVIGENIALMQFTGLLDADKKEIYVGDLIQEEGGYVTQIVFDEHTNKADLDMDIYMVGFLRKWKDGTLSPLGYYNGLTGKVIGNIYTTPELLNS